MKKRVHRSALYGLVQVLEKSFNQGSYAEKALEKHFHQNRVMGSRDRQFFAETFYETIRWWRRLRFSMGFESERLEGQYRDQELKAALSAWLLLNDYDLSPFAREGFGGDLERARRRWEEVKLDSVRESYPDWLWEKGENELGPQQWIEVARNSNQVAPLFLRVNRLRATTAEVKKKLAEELVETNFVSSSPDALRLPVRKNVFATKSFKEGVFEVQDLGSQMIAPLVEVEPGMRVIDACAGAGGKTLHLAALMNNRGRILAMDIHDWKLRELRTRLRRAQVDNVEVKLIDSSKAIKRLRGQADRLLLDVPCSGSGVMRRKPDTKWKLTSAECKRLVDLQKEILHTYSDMVKVGGKMVYATCSIFPSENEWQVRQFLEQHPEWELEREFNWSPKPNGSDGFYCARLIKK